MTTIGEPQTASAGEFCWLDLAATSADSARSFYRAVFGWNSRKQAANGGHFVRLQLAGRDVGSLYQISAASRDCGVASHWLPYVRVADVGDAAQRAMANGGQLLVRPFTVDGVARIALISDAVGARIGLWETLTREGDAASHD